MDFETRFKKLNKNQQLAVTTTEGPVMVVAGPGTGKTELLGMRVAYILKNTDVLPENILCLTFTESGSIAMRKRLVEIIGKDAYRVSIYTFHAFGSEIINQHREYFYEGATFAPADDIQRRNILEGILNELDYNNPLRSSMNGEYTAIGDIISSISDLKRSSLTPDELDAILAATAGSISSIEPLVSEALEGRISKTTEGKLSEVLNAITTISEPVIIETIPTFIDTFRRGLETALQEAQEHPKVTPPLTAWKADWTTADANKNRILKASKSLVRLVPLASAYRQYLERMTENELYDYDDMIMQVVHALHKHPDLLFDLQEKYQYFMIDEFQDTNLAQMRILNQLTDNPVNEGRPNILTVGDDDQAIYGFQGADVGNILFFKDNYPTAEVITLTDNYRSTKEVLTTAQAVISQGEERLVQRIEGLNKTLEAHRASNETKTVLTETLSPDHERQWVSEHIKNTLDEGKIEPKDIAILARRHSDLEAIAPFLIELGVPVSYDRMENVLEDEVVIHLLMLARIITSIAKQKHDVTNSLMPEMLAYSAWGIPPVEVWRISLRASKDRKKWLEIMVDNPDTQQLAEWLIATAATSTHTPIERMFDILTGEATVEGSEFKSPLKDFYFSQEKIDARVSDYITHLAHLTAIRDKFREHTGSNSHTQLLADFLAFVDQLITTNTNVMKSHTFKTSDNAVQLMSAHGSKGLEFNTVYILNAADPMWGEKATGRSSVISYPPNLRLRQNNNTYEERLRLFFVAMTRAKQNLYISYPTQGTNGKEIMKAGFLVKAETLEQNIASGEVSEETRQATAQHIWHQHIANTPQQTIQEALQPILENYKLSATHLNSFLDVTKGGPRNFMLSNLIRFPSAMTPHASYGSAVHAALQYAHEKVIAGFPPTADDVISHFKSSMETRDFESKDLEDFTKRGEDALRVFLEEKLDAFNPNQRTELDFARQNVFLGEAHLTGKLDIVELDPKEKTAHITDYKTGKALPAWDKGTPYQKTKSHQYKQQLLFYQLLISNSKDWQNYDILKSCLQFVEPTENGSIAELSFEEVDHDELDRLNKLICKVWNKIKSADFPDTSQYEENAKGIAQFEEDLLNDLV